MGITQETLKNGKVLRALVHQFLAEQNQQNLLAILKCLRDSYVWIPCNVNISEADTEQFLNAQVGDTVTSAEDIRLHRTFCKTEIYSTFLYSQTVIRWELTMVIILVK